LDANYIVACLIFSGNQELRPSFPSFPLSATLAADRNLSPMELLLNLLWLVVAVGLTGFLLRHQRTRALRPHWGIVLAATLFIVVLLFPAISASDDLYGELFLSEDASRRAHNVITAHLELAPAVALLSSILFSPSLGGLRSSEHIVESSALISLPSAFRLASGLRAPPVVASFL
jgi:hypothetical protein